MKSKPMKHYETDFIYLKNIKQSTACMKCHKISIILFSWKAKQNHVLSNIDQGASRA